MQKKTIALIVPTLCGGGAEKIAADMSFFLSAAGYRVVFFLDEFDKNYCYRHKGKVIVIKTYSSWDTGNLIKKLYHCLRRSWKYRLYKKQYKVDISISFMVQENLINLLSDVGDKKILTLHSVTSLIDEYQGQLFAKPYVLRKLYPRADAVISVSKYVKWDLEQWTGLHKGITNVIYNPVNILELRDKAKEPTNVKQYENLILYVGRLDDIKRPWIAVRVMQDIARRICNAKLVMLGVGENKYLLKRLIKCFHLENSVMLLGYEENVAKYMVKAKVLITCSEAEACPCALQEALAMGLPVVSVDCPGGICEIISSNSRNKKQARLENMVVECGIITPRIATEKKNANSTPLSEEEEMFAQGICMLLEDESLRTRLSRNAEKRAQKFDQDKIKKEWLVLLENIKGK